MSAPRSFEHTHLRVSDLGRALDFYAGLMGLIEVAREDGVVYLGAGLDENYDLAVSEGGTGVEHFAIRVADAEALEGLQRSLADAGVPTERRDGTEPGQEAGVRFELPSGIAMELVVVADQRYLEPYRPARGGGAARGGPASASGQATRGAMGVLDADHINLVATDVRWDADFLLDVLGFRCSDRIVLEGGSWMAAWLRHGGYHHDVAVVGAENAAEATLHHLAWTCASFDHLKQCCDLLAEHGIQLELGVGRHPVGANLFAYFWDPGGNRTELCAEMAVLSAATETRVWSSPVQTLNAWNDSPPPPSFGVAS